MNFSDFFHHPHAIFLQGTSDMETKVKFINTCDAMLHARLQGESFGLACGEFSIRNKPVITCRFGKHTHHIHMLGSKGFYYHDEPSLVEIINNLQQNLGRHTNWDCYSETCSPSAVMSVFDKYLIQPALRNPQKNKPEISLGYRETLAYWKFKWQMHRHHHKSHA